jgi:hypothetical protein
MSSEEGIPVLFDEQCLNVVGESPLQSNLPEFKFLYIPNQGVLK